MMHNLPLFLSKLAIPCDAHGGRHHVQPTASPIKGFAVNRKTRLFSFLRNPLSAAPSKPAIRFNEFCTDFA